MKFLIDECLHTSLIEVAEVFGHEAAHVNYRGLSGVQDWNLMEPIRSGDFTFVTNNARDFRRLFSREEVHAGLVIIVPNAPPAEQRELFAAVLDEIEDGESLVNEVIEVGIFEDEVQIARYELPANL